MDSQTIEDTERSRSMNLPFFKNFNKKILPLHYLVLVLRDEKAQAVIFEELEGRAKIIGQKEQHFSSSIDEISLEELLEVLDKAISSAESSLPENIQTQKTIFGVKESWTDNDQIKKEYLAKLKKASEELGLVPIGFLVISQAISHLLQKEEGAPISAILAEINKKSVTVTLLRAGKNMETKSSEIHESIPFTVDTLLKHFNVPEILPSRIIIFNGKEDLSQEFISHTWSKSLPFLHLPQITNLPHDFDAKAVLFGAATQMGFKVLEKDISKEPRAAHKLSEEETQAVNSEENPIEAPTLYKNLGAQDFGFVKDVDVAKMPAPRSLGEVGKFQPTRNVSPARQSPDGSSRTADGQSVAGGESADQKEIIPQINTEETLMETKSPKRLGNVLTLLRNILIFILGLIFAVAGKINIKKISPLAPKGKLSIIVPAILILIIVLIASYFLFIKATITLTVDPKISEQNKSVLFSTTGITDPGRNIIKGEFISVSEDGNVSAPATGKKDVGTNAKGTVIIYNDGDTARALAEGAILKAPNGLAFTLDSSTTIKAVASHSANENPPPEKTTANVTANQLGKESNLPSGTKFTVASFDTSELIAINDNPFSGGTKKEVTVASKNDSTKLEGDLLKQLENKARKDLEKQLGQNKILLPVFIAENLSKKSLNVKVGDEANQLTLTGTVEYQGISYDRDDLIRFSKSLLSKNVPSNQEIDYNNIKTSVLEIKNINDDEVEANLNIKTLLLPKIDKSKLIKDLKGKSFKATEDLLYKLPQVANVNIKLFPNLPFLPKNLPAREKNIIIKILING